MWRARPLGLFSRRQRVEEGGRTIGTLAFGTWSERGALELDGRRLAIRREGFWNPRFHLEDEGGPLASSRPAGAFRRGFCLLHGDEEYRLQPSSFFSRSFDLWQGARLRGRIQALGMFRRGARVELDEELAPELRLFALWLVCLAWHRQAMAAAS